MIPEGHPIPREAMRRISDIDGGYLPRERAALEAEDTPPVTAEDTVTTAEKAIFVAGAVVLLVIVYAVTRFAWPILYASFTLWRNQQ